MINPILFRGGMHGDLLLGMLDSTALQKNITYEKDYKRNTVGEYHIKYTRTLQKKFFQYTDVQKQKYYERFSTVKNNVWVLTHDTDFSYNYPQTTIQLICSDTDLIKTFARRFYKLHNDNVTKEASLLIKNNTGDFIDDYANDIIQWQTYHNFSRRFDIKNIYNQDKFLQDFEQFFHPSDIKRSRNIYQKHFEKK